MFLSGKRKKGEEEDDEDEVGRQTMIVR